MKGVGVLLLTVGILLPHHPVSSFPNNGYKIQLGRNSKTNGIEYATHRPYKADFDLLRVSERSQELAMPLVLSNDLLDAEGKGDDSMAIRILTSDPTLRSRRKRQIPLSHQVQSSSSPLHHHQNYQNFNLCLPHYSNSNPLCRQIFFGLNPAFPNNSPGGQQQQQQHHHQHLQQPHQLRASALAVPASSPAFLIPSSSLSQHPATGALSITPAGAATLNRNELAILANYYQPQELPPQTPLQVGIFQGPLPGQRQRPQLDGIHTKYPYPYPPTLDIAPQSPVPDSGSVGDEATNGATTDYPVDGGVSGSTTYVPMEQTEGQQQQQQQGGQQDSTAAASFPDSPAGSPEGLTEGSTQNAEASSTAPPASVSLPAAVGGLTEGGLNQQFQLQEIAMQKRIREMEEEVRQLQAQLEQANLQVVSYEHENSMVKEQFQRSEEANLKLRDRVLQLENTNQHLQDQNGQLQQLNTEQRQDTNSLKEALREAKEQLSSVQQQQQLQQQQQSQQQPAQKPSNSVPSEEALKHRKEIEGFLIRIRKLGEENETCKKQVKLYQLKVSYIQNQQRGKDKDEKQKDEPAKAGEEPQKHVEFQDDELDPELSRMDAEIAALQKNADEVAAEINNLQPPLSSAIPESAVPVKVAEQKVVPPQTVEVKNEGEFPGEAVEIPQRASQPEQPEKKTVATAEEVGRAPTWEKPEGF